MPLALNDVAEQLRRHGWEVDAAIYATAANGDPRGETRSLRSTFLSNRLEPWQRWRALMNLWLALPENIRQFTSILTRPNSYFVNASNNLQAIEQILASCHADLVLVCVDGSAPGTAALVAERHPRVAAISLAGLANELNAQWWDWMRGIVAVRLRSQAHPFLFRRVLPHQLRYAVFASRHWQGQATQAGLKAPSHTIYFGVPLPEPLPRVTNMRGRLLWVGQMTRNKGLHLFLEALPQIRKRIPKVTLTVVATEGLPGYRELVRSMIRKYNLQDIVTILPPVPRSALRQLYAEHDILLFYSIYAEPVALVLMEAYAAGIPVVSSKANGDALLAQDQVTCLCYDPRRIETLVDAVARMYNNAEMRRIVSHRAQEIVRENFSLAAMGDAYDRLLHTIINENP
ncbi:MAG: glycosyltransferase family 4 protein [Chloroflexi bacterium]|nr:glycosyltransferase family 4 protein [Chloroflexota bacterium]